jgi:hypothetical protein
MPNKTPEPDEFGRYRVETDTGAKVSVSRAPLDGEKVLDEPASDVAGDALPVEYASTPRSLSSPTNSGQSADLKKEKADG